MPQLDWDRLDRHRPIAVEEILTWADAYHARHGKWPRAESGAIPETGGTWAGVTSLLREGYRGLARGNSLPRILEKYRGADFRHRPPALSETQILAWADAHFATHGKWPGALSGTIAGTRETWAAVHNALVGGWRGLPGNSSIARLLAKKRGVRNRAKPPPLTKQRILAWADAHHKLNGHWPKALSGRVLHTDENWNAIDRALTVGGRGLRKGSSLAQLLAAHRGLRNSRRLPSLTEKQILAWARAYLATHGKRPTAHSGSIPRASEKWSAINEALRRGLRGLPGGSSLSKLLQKHGLK
jgi:hypothetical protein